MLHSTLTSLFIAAAMLGQGVLSHPGHEHHEDPHAAALKRSFLEHARRSVDSCHGSAAKRAASDAWAQRRALEIKHLRDQIASRKKRSLKNRDSAALTTSHNSTLTGITANTTSTDIFGTTVDNSTCILQPEVTIGPYWVSGEYVRPDIREDQGGVTVYMSAQFVDVATCSPVPDVYWETWHCNSTGVYSGVVASGNGDSSDTSNLNATFLRGMQKTDSLGVAQIISIVPGHYNGRANHVHVIAHANATVYANGTIGTGASGDSSTAIHIGQLFFDQDLITAVEATAPYNTNNQTHTLNADDSILAQETASSDPFFNYVYLGSDVSDGIYAWATIGVDTTQTVAMSAAAYLTPDGGVATNNTMGPGGGGNMTVPGNMTGGPGNMTGGPGGPGGLGGNNTAITSSSPSTVVLSSVNAATSSTSVPSHAKASHSPQNDNSQGDEQ